MSATLDRSLVWVRRPSSSLDLGGTTIAVVGGTNGLGRAIARLAAARGARVLVVGRSFRDDRAAGIEFLEADLRRMTEAALIEESEALVRRALAAGAVPSSPS